MNYHIDYNTIVTVACIPFIIALTAIGYTDDVDPCPGILTPLKMTGFLKNAIY